MRFVLWRRGHASARAVTAEELAQGPVTLGSDYRTIFKIGRSDSIFSPIGSV